MRLRKPCEHDRYDAHYVGRLVYGISEVLCPGGEFLPEGAAILWCMEHDAELRWLQSKQCWEASVEVQDNPCRLVQMLVVALADQVGEPV